MRLLYFTGAGFAATALFAAHQLSLPAPPDAAPPPDRALIAAHERDRRALSAEIVRLRGEQIDLWLAVARRDALVRELRVRLDALRRAGVPLEVPAAPAPGEDPADLIPATNLPTGN